MAGINRKSVKESCFGVIDITEWKLHAIGGINGKPANLSCSCVIDVAEWKLLDGINIKPALSLTLLNEKMVNDINEETRLHELPCVIDTIEQESDG